MHMSAHDQRTAAAYHEAGHLAVACHYGLPVAPVTIHAAHAQNEHDHAPLPVTPANAARSDGSFETLNLITCLIAGGIAEEKYSDQLNVDVAEQDYEQAWRLAIEVADTERGAEALMNWLTIRAEQDVNHLWNEITAIAAVLIEKGTVSPEHVRALSREPDRRRTGRAD